MAGTRPLVFDGVPGRSPVPEVEHFFGRVNELREAGRGLASPDIRTLVIGAVGGAGKTALALELAHRHAWRFKGGIAMAGTPRTLAVALTAGRARPALLLVEDVDRLRPADVAEIAALLAALPDNGTKAIVTVRSLPATLELLPHAMILRVSAGLTEAAATAYVLRLGAAHHVPGLFAVPEDQSTQYARALAASLHGHPAMLELLVERLAQGDRDAVLHELVEFRGGHGAFEDDSGGLAARLAELVASSFAGLDAPGRTVASLVGILPALTFTFDELAQMARALRSGQQTADFLRAGLARCLRACLIREDAETRVYRIDLVVRVVMGRSIPLEPDTAGPAVNYLFNHVVAFCAQHCDDFAALERRAELFEIMFEYAWSNGDAELRRSLAQVVTGLLDFYQATGRQSQLHAWLERLGGEPARSPAVASHDAAARIVAGRIDEARTAELERLGRAMDTGDVEGEVSSLIQVADSELRLGLHVDAAAHLGRAGDLLDRAPDPVRRTQLTHMRGRLALATADHGAARSLLEDAHRGFVARGDHGGGVRCLVDLADSLLATGDLPAARHTLEDARVIIGDRRLTAALASVLEKLAAVASGEGDLIEARALLEEALESNMQRGDAAGVANALFQLAQVENKRGHYEESLALAQKAAGLRREAGEIREWVRASLAVAGALAGMRRNDQALSVATNALAVAERIGDTRSSAVGTHVVAGIHLGLGNLDAAAQFYRRAAELIEGGPSERDLGDVYASLAAIELRRGDLAEARSLLDKAIAVAERHRHPMALAMALGQLAQLERRAGALAVARAHLARALRIAEEVGSHHMRAAILSSLGHVLLDVGETAEGRQRMDDAARVLDEIRSPDAVLVRALLEHGAPGGAIDLDAIISKAMGLLHGGQEQQARALLQPLVAYIDPIEHRRHLAAVRTIIAGALYVEERYADSLVEVDKALPLTDEDVQRDELLQLRDILAKELEICAMASVSVDTLRERTDDPLELIDLLANKALGHVAKFTAS